MKRSTMLSLFTISTILAATPLFSAEATKDATGEYGQYEKKDECLLYAKNCANETDTLQERIERLQYEIQKGTAVYTPDELNTLNRQLKDAYKNYYDIIKGGDGHRPRMHHVR